MRVLLAPMEGVLDSLVRELLTEVNDYDLCITEFVRVVDQLLPAKVFHRLCPELHNNSRTPSGTLVRIQLLGQYPQWLAENAARAVELGSYGVDLNCGCPSKLVNGSGGGATLLKDPELIYRGAKAMREAVPAHLPVTVKVRLGWDWRDPPASDYSGYREWRNLGLAKRPGLYGHQRMRCGDDRTWRIKYSKPEPRGEIQRAAYAVA